MNASSYPPRQTVAMQQESYLQITPDRLAISPPSTGEKNDKMYHQGSSTDEVCVYTTWRRKVKEFLSPRWPLALRLHEAAAPCSQSVKCDNHGACLRVPYFIPTATLEHSSLRPMRVAPSLRTETEIRI